MTASEGAEPGEEIHGGLAVSCCLSKIRGQMEVKKFLEMITLEFPSSLISSEMARL